MYWSPKKFIFLANAWEFNYLAPESKLHINIITERQILIVI